MTPDRLTNWIFKVCPGGKRLQLTHEQAIGQGLVVASWGKEEVDAAREAEDESFGRNVQDTAQDHADSVGEACRFVLAWVTDDLPARLIRSVIHRCQPTEKPDNVFADHADKVSGNATVGQLLSHIAAQQRVINGSISVILQAYDRALAMQSSMFDRMSKRFDQLPELMASTRTAEDERVTQLKIVALEKLSDVAPDMMRLMISAAEHAITKNAHGGANGTAIQ